MRDRSTAVLAPAPAARKGRPVLTLALLAVAVLLSVSVALAMSDRQTILEDPPESVGLSLTSIWSTAVLVLLAVVVAALRPRTRAVRVAILALVVPVLAAGVVGTVRLQQLSDSGFIREAQEGKARAGAAQADLEKRLVIAASAVCRGTPVPRAATVGEPPRVVVLDEQGRLYGWAATRGRGWAPRSVEELQVVACLGPETRSVETCRYTGGASYELTSFQRPMSVLEATDGTVLLDAEPVTGAGAECYETLVGGQVPQGVTAEHVDADAVLDAIEGVLP